MLDNFLRYSILYNTLQPITSWPKPLGWQLYLYKQDPTPYKRPVTLPGPFPEYDGGYFSVSSQPWMWQQSTGKVVNRVVMRTAIAKEDWGEVTHMAVGIYMGFSLRGLMPIFYFVWAPLVKPVEILAGQQGRFSKGALKVGLV